MTNGFVPRRRVKTVTCEWEELAPEDGADPLWASIATDLTFGQIDDINRERLNPNQTWAGLFALVAPHVFDWNVVAFDNASGELVRVDPPAEAGPDAFRATRSVVATWIAGQLGQVHLGGEERQKKSPASDDTSAPSDDATSTSPPKTTNSRKRRAST